MFCTPIIFLMISMGKLIRPEIRDNYTFYSDLLSNRKSVNEKVIDISNAKPTNKNFLINDNVLLKHITLVNEIVFISEVKARNYKYFHFKIKCVSLSDVPFFRYDSDGAAHRNYDDNIPLAQQQITTPHFHNFNIDGVSLAYKTKELLNDASRQALEDISLCVAHFCHEGNIRLGKDDFPSISILSKTLGLTMTEDDPNAGVNFI